MTWSAAPVSSTTELCPKERECFVVGLLLLRRYKMQYQDRIHKMFVIATNIYLPFILIKLSTSLFILAVYQYLP